MRDSNGSIRICDRGNVPICDEDAEQERVLLESRLASSRDSEQTYERLLSDINIMV
jgi:glutamate mutase epsilon subunit